MMRQFAALALMTMGCATGPGVYASTVRPIDEDQLALLPAGADAVIDVDMEQLRTWAPARRFFALLPRDAHEQLTKIGIDPWVDIDGIVMALSGLGSEQPTATLLLRGDLDPQKVAAGLTAGAYGNMPIWESPERAVGKLSPRMLVLGPPVEVRRVIDLVRGQGLSLRAAERELVQAFARAPSAKGGRPAVIAAVAPSPLLRERFKSDQLPGGEYDWLTLVMAVGNGFDLLVIGKAKSAGEAGGLAANARASVDQLKARPLMRALGLDRFLGDVIVCPGEMKCMPFAPDEVRMVFRLPGNLLDIMLRHLETLMAAVKK